MQQSCLYVQIISEGDCLLHNVSVALTDMDMCELADALLALASPSLPAAATEQPAAPLRLTAIPHHVATQRTGNKLSSLL